MASQQDLIDHMHYRPEPYYKHNVTTVNECIVGYGRKSEFRKINKKTNHYKLIIFLPVSIT